MSALQLRRRESKGLPSGWPAAVHPVLQQVYAARGVLDPSQVEHRLARLLGDTDMVRLPLIDPARLAECLTAGIRSAELDRRAAPPDIAALHQRLFGDAAAPGWADSLHLAPGSTVRDLYRQAVATEQFQVACGRISASYAW